MKILNAFLDACIITYSIYTFKAISLTVSDLIKFTLTIFIINISFLHYSYMTIPLTTIALITLLYMRSKKLTLSIILPVLLVPIVGVSETIYYNICVWILGLKLETFLQNQIGYIIFNFFVYITVILIIILLRDLTKRIVNIKNINFKSKFTLFAFSSLILTFIMFFLSCILVEKLNLSSKITSIVALTCSIYFVLLTLIVYTLSNNVKKELEFVTKKKELDNLKEYTENLELLYNEMRKFRHDYINILTSMIGYMEQNDMEGLRKYFNNNIMSISTSFEKNNFRLGLLQNIKIPEVKGIIASKLIRAQQKEIDVFIDIMDPIEQINMDIIDICRVTGIILDNAIEAAEQCDNPIIKFAIIDKETSVMLMLINTCCKNTPPIYKLFQKSFSTKGENRGLGLCNLREIINSYSNVSLDTLIEDGAFTQSIEVGKF